MHVCVGMGGYDLNCVLEDILHFAYLISCELIALTVIPVVSHIFMPHPMRWGHNVSMAIVCPSVWPMPDPKSRIEWCRNVKIGRKEAYDTGDL